LNDGISDGTLTIDLVRPDQPIEWSHPFGHRWRWEFEATLRRLHDRYTR
jgi:hypothetical protein